MVVIVSYIIICLSPISMISEAPEKKKKSDMAPDMMGEDMY